MPNPMDGQELIAAFFANLELRHLSECETILTELQALSHQQTAYTPWCTYFEGILANERDRNWAKAEHIFSGLLLVADLDPPLQGRALLALGRTYDLQGRWPEAIQTCQRSLPLFAQLSQPIDQAKAWKQMALSYYGGFTQGDFDSTVLLPAIAYCRQALHILEPIATPELTWLKGSLWNALGFLHVALGRLNEALVCYQQDLAFCQAQDDRFGMGLSYGNLGEVYQKQGNYEPALAAYHQALTIIREFDDPYEAIEALANLAFLYQEMGLIEAALAHYQQAIQLIETLRAGISSETAQAGFFATVVDTYAQMALLCLATHRAEQSFNLVEQARSRAFLDLLAARSPDLLPQVEARPLTLPEIQTALPADTLLLEYFTTGLIEAREGRPNSQNAQRHRFPPAQTWLFAVTHNGLQVYNTGLSPNDLRPRQLDSVVERHFLQPQIRRSLYDRLISPIEPLLGDKRRVYIAPHGPLHYIPFQALLAADGETLLRQAGPELVYTPSATLLFGRNQPRSNSMATATCLALGYNGQEPKQLHFAEEEAQTVARLTGGRVLAGALPKKADLFEQAAGYRLLHLSCHGDFNPESPLASALQIAPEESLTALDVFQHLHLYCDLVTLSACESGLNRIRRGDELVGLTRAFMFAGAKALISTLWRVDEQSTRILMEMFYQNIGQGIGFAQALKQAQLSLKQLTQPAGESDEKIFADPFYWAPFILVGNPGDR